MSGDRAARPMPDRAGASGLRSVAFEASRDGELHLAALAAVRDAPPTELAGRRVTRVGAVTGTGRRDDGVVLEVDGGRVVVRPSAAVLTLDVEVEAPSDLAALVDAAVAIVAAAPEGPAARDGQADDLQVQERADDLMAARRDVVTAADLRTIVSCIDLTTLEGGDTAGRIRALCATARRPHPTDPTVGPVAAVCVYPALAGLVAELVADSPVRTASVAGAFPSALSTPDARLADVEAAVRTGADEIDVVLDRSAFLDGRIDDVAQALDQARRVVGDRRMKVILEVGELGSLGSVRAAAELAMESGADFVKTSTGKIPAGATPAAALCMAEAIAEHRSRTGRRVGLKVSGGVRDAATAAGYLHLVRTTLGDEWAGPDRFRIGASGLLGDVIAAIPAGDPNP